MKTLKMMKKYILLFLLMAVGIISGVCGQEHTKKIPPKGGPRNLLLPVRDTVIMRGEEVEVGAYLKEKIISEIEIIGFGKSKKSDMAKGYYVIKQKPKRTITYDLKWYNSFSKTSSTSQRTIYVAKTEEEKKQLEEKLKEEKKGKYHDRSFMKKLLERVREIESIEKARERDSIMREEEKKKQ